jgi:hypothetical protein
MVRGFSFGGRQRHRTVTSALERVPKRAAAKGLTLPRGDGVCRGHYGDQPHPSRDQRQARRGASGNAIWQTWGRRCRECWYRTFPGCIPNSGEDHRSDEEGTNGRVGGSDGCPGASLHSTSTSTRGRSLCQHHRSRRPPGLHRRLPARRPDAQKRGRLPREPPPGSGGPVLPELLDPRICAPLRKTGCADRMRHLVRVLPAGQGCGVAE